MMWILRYLFFDLPPQMGKTLDGASFLVVSASFLEPLMRFSLSFVSAGRRPSAAAEATASPRVRGGA